MRALTFGTITAISPSSVSRWLVAVPSSAASLAAAVGRLIATRHVTNTSCSQCETHTSVVSCAAVGSSSVSSSLGKGDVASPRNRELFYHRNCNSINRPSVVPFFGSPSSSEDSPEERVGRAGAFLVIPFALRVFTVTHRLVRYACMKVIEPAFFRGANLWSSCGLRHPLGVRQGVYLL